MRAIPESISSRLEPAASVFADRGFDHTRIEDLAEATGIPRATLYYYFSGKEEILAYLLRQMLALTAETVAAAAGGPGTSRERLQAVVRAYLGVMAAHPDCNRALAADFGRAARAPDLAASVRAGFHEPVRALLAAGEADGSLRALGDLETAASAIYGAVVMAGLHYLLADNRLEADRVAPAVCELVLTGIGTEKRSPPAEARGPLPSNC